MSSLLDISAMKVNAIVSARQALLYHADIDFAMKVNLVNRKFNWSQIARRLKEAVFNPDKLFPAIQQSIRRGRRR